MCKCVNIKVISTCIMASLHLLKLLKPKEAMAIHVSFFKCINFKIKLMQYCRSEYLTLIDVTGENQVNLILLFIISMI